MRRAALALCFLLPSLAASASHAPPPDLPAAPARKCEIRYSAWCIEQGAFEIVSRLAEDSVHDRVWLLRGQFRPQSKLVVLEPHGCRTGVSDTLSLSSFERSVEWEGRKWDRLRARLKSDGSCDLEVLMPPFDGDPMEWAFSTGLMLFKACEDEQCVGPSLAELKPRFEERYRLESNP